ncbi:MAG: hypothetical protein WDW36_006301 [Sanguina aurantia]
MNEDTEHPQLPPERGTADAWSKSLAKVVPACLVLKVTQTRAFDTEAACSMNATGFIVDKARGIVLTNRHVVTPGPIVAEAVFTNREELSVLPVYRDPIHDFGFLRFDPSKLQYMEVAEVPLCPQAAAVGLDIRVVGNDSGEKISILSGTLARLDRDAPNYGKKGFNDFNTFYLQAASGTRGGSSGSPVIDCHGRAVALNAAGKNKTAQAFYLPLERAVRALKLIQAANPLGQPWVTPLIPRGDLQTTFLFKGFDDVRRLGLRACVEKEVREGRPFVNTTEGAADAKTLGMLVVESTLPGSPAHGVLETGDVLVRMDGSIVTHFQQMAEILDDAVSAGAVVRLELERLGVMVAVSLHVTDLHSVTPDSFLELAGGSLNSLSYQQARNNNATVGQVYVADPGDMLGCAHVPQHAIVTQLAGQPTPDLESFASVLRSVPQGSRVPVEYFTFGAERFRKKNTIMLVNRQWYGSPVYWARDDHAGVWHPTTEYPAAGGLPTPPQPSKPVQAVATTASGTAMEMEGVVKDLTMTVDATAVEQSQAEVYEENLRCSFVLMNVDIPMVALADGVHSRSFTGNGLVVHHSATLGLVVVDRNTVPVGPADVNLSFGAHPAELAARIVFLHPLHNFAILAYNPEAMLPETRALVRAAPLLTHPPLRRGDSVKLVGLSDSLRIKQRTSVVTNATVALTIPAAEVPRFRAVHEEVVKLDQDFGTAFSGVLTDDLGAVRCLWGSYSEQVNKSEREWCAGLPSALFQPWVAKLVAALTTPPGETHACRVPEVA